MTVTSASVRWYYTCYDTVSEGISYNSFNITAGFPCINGSSLSESTRFDYYQRGGAPIKLLNYSGSNDNGFVVILSGNLTGACFIPPNSPTDVDLSGMFMHLPLARGIQGCIKQTSDFPDGFDDISENGKYYKDDSGNWRNVSDDNIVATSQEVSNLPQGVDFNGWLIEHEIIAGSDGNYYDLGGNELFQNLPSGVTPVSQIISPSDDGSGNLSDGVFEGTDGNYYNVEGYRILENLPSGVTPVSQVGDVVVGSDGRYYDLHGDSAMQNLPSGVTITGYDDVNHVYHGSDGKDYDINGDEVEGGQDICDGVELTFTPSIRLTVDCIDIFGNQQNIGADITVGQLSLDFASLFNFNYIRQINRVTARSLGNANQSVGNGVLRVRGNVVGAKVAVDLEGVDVDGVLGSYEVVACNFNMCDRYATPILNNDLPLGLANHTDLDVGYFVLNQFLYFEWEGFNDVFPYCCPSYNNDEKESGSTPSPIEDKDMSKLIESIDKLTEAVQGLSTLVEVVVSPAEDVNVYNRRFHYNDSDGVSGFSS